MTNRETRRAQQEADVAALAALVARYNLRWTEDRDRPYPADEMGACPSAWLPIVEALVEELIALGWNRHVAQVKEKLGGLRFYIGEGSEAMEAAIERACARCPRG
jgi:hypothetical protein